MNDIVDTIAKIIFSILVSAGILFLLCITLCFIIFVAYEVSMYLNIPQIIIALIAAVIFVLICLYVYHMLDIL